MHARSRFGGWNFREDKVRALLSSDDVYAATWRSAAGIRGLFIGVIYPELWTDAKVACDVALYVSGANKGFAAKRLVESFEAWARERGASEIRMGITAGINDDGADRFYEGMDYRDGGRLKVKEV